MANTKYYIKLSDEERTFLTKIVCEGKDSDRTIMRARILLMSDATQPERLSIDRMIYQDVKRRQRDGGKDSES